tara:strand:- start:676 stop:1269 length:594 start_codon:yes stop_codon:yes gene_type:complete
MITPEQKADLWRFARMNSQSKLYFLHHECKVAWGSNEVAKELDANPDISEIAGLMHDLGYSVDTGDHIQASVDLASRALAEFGVGYDEANKIKSAISTHDSHLDVLSTPLENVVVNDVDAGSFFRFYRGMAQWMYREIMTSGTPRSRLADTKSALLDHADETESYMSHPEIRARYEEDVRRFKQRIDSLTYSDVMKV